MTGRNDGDDDDDDNDGENIHLKSLQEQEKAAMEKSSSSSSSSTSTCWSKTQIDAAINIIQELKFPHETTSLALKRLEAHTQIAASAEKGKKSRSVLLEATASFEMAVALTSSYSSGNINGLKNSQQQQKEEKPIQQQTRDEILDQLLRLHNNTKLSPRYFLCWTETCPKIPDTPLTDKNVFGPFEVSELNGWCKRGFFEKKQAFIFNVNVKKEERSWIAVPRKTADSI